MPWCVCSNPRLRTCSRWIHEQRSVQQISGSCWLQRLEKTGVFCSQYLAVSTQLSASLVDGKTRLLLERNSKPTGKETLERFPEVSFKFFRSDLCRKPTNSTILNCPDTVFSWTLMAGLYGKTSETELTGSERRVVEDTKDPPASCMDVRDWSRRRPKLWNQETIMQKMNHNCLVVNQASWKIWLSHV